ncbi:MAG: tRNA 4-thiouridine(8) synthase ThiI [bacterium]
MRAVGLFSGGLDSIISSHLIIDQNISVLCVFISAPFITSSFDTIIRSFKSIERRGGELIRREISSDYLDILKKPKYGYGSGINPCIDCHIYMLKIAKQLMLDTDADFVFTGEVLGERPMSQNRRALKIIEVESGLRGILLRPLSAKLLIPTDMQLKGKLKRDYLFSIKGRSRKPQLELAKIYNLDFIPSSGGGCLLTNKAYSVRVRESMKYEELSLKVLRLLKYGRHFRLPSGEKLIVGRNEKENIELEKNLDLEYIIFKPVNVVGPTALMMGNNDIELASSILARYCDGEGSVKVRINIESTVNEIIVKRLEDSKVRELMVI